MGPDDPEDEVTYHDMPVSQFLRRTGFSGRELQEIVEDAWDRVPEVRDSRRGLYASAARVASLYVSRNKR